jgi:hypothetical protein
MSLANGQLIMYKGLVCGNGSRIITTIEGQAEVRNKGLTALVIDLADQTLLKRG